MAAPVDAGRATTDGSTSTTSQTLNLPGSISAGDLLIATIRAATNPTSISWPAGWTEVDQSSGDASDDTQSIAVRVADGSEGATIAVTLGAAARIAGLCYRITGADTADLSSVVSGSSSAPNSGSYDISSGSTSLDALDVLWLSIGGMQTTTTITTQPTGYSNQTAISNTGSTGNGTCTVIGASKQATSVTAAEDPGAWAMSGSGAWLMWTIATYTASTDALVTQLPVEGVVGPADENARVSQEPVEAVIGVSDLRARVTQDPVEVVVERSATPPRVTQLPVEVVVSYAQETYVRISQEPTEALILPSDQKLRMSQEPTEALILPSDQKLRMSQAVVEVLVFPITISTQGFRAYIID